MINTNNYDVLNRIWDYTQYKGASIPMYRTRISASTTAWIVELPDSKLRTAFLLQFGQYVTSVMNVYYV